MLQELYTLIESWQIAFVHLDILVVLAVLLGLIGYLFTVGKDHGVVVMISTYIAAATVAFLPFVQEIPDWQITSSEWSVVVFFGLIASLTFLQLKNGFFEPVTVPDGWERVLFAVVITGMVTVTTVTLLSEALLPYLSAEFMQIFLEDPYQNTWFLLPLLTMVFLKPN